MKDAMYVVCAAVGLLLVGAGIAETAGATLLGRDRAVFRRKFAHDGAELSVCF